MNEVILLHGFCENHSIWDPVKDVLDAYSVNAFDLPGFGTNEMVIETMDDLADDVIRQMDQAKITAACVIGHSMGGYVALNLLKRYPHRLTGLGLFHSTAYSDSTERKEARNRAIEHITQYGADGYLKEMASNLIWINHPEHDDLASRVHELIKNERSEGLIQALKAMRDRSAETEVLQQTELPVLMVAGFHDTFIPWKDLFTQASQCRQVMLHRMNHCGHLGPFEAVSESRQILLEFVNWVYQR